MFKRGWNGDGNKFCGDGWELIGSSAWMGGDVNELYVDACNFCACADV